MLCANWQSPTWLLCLASNWKASSNHMNRGHLPPPFVREAGRAVQRVRNAGLGKAEALSAMWFWGAWRTRRGLERSRREGRRLWHSARVPQLLSNAQSERGRSLFGKVSWLCISWQVLLSTEWDWAPSFYWCGLQLPNAIYREIEDRLQN